MCRKEWCKTVIAGFDFFKKKGVMLVVGGVILGVLMIIFGSYGGKNETESKIEFDEKSYTASLENTAKEMLSQVDGVGEVKVAVTLDSAYETVYARDGDAGNGYIKVRSSDGDESGLMLSVRMPKVRGVAVVCEKKCGADLKREMIDLLTALFDISSADVFVGA